MTKPFCPPPNRVVRQPEFAPPPLSCDCHVHVIGPQSQFPLPENAPVRMEDCTLDDLEAVHDALGIERAILVASIAYGFDYQIVLQSLRARPGRFRGIVNLDPDIDDDELVLLAGAGVTGARFFPGNPPTDRMLGRIGELGWSANLLIPTEELFDAWSSLFAGFAGKIVLEHSGLPDPGEGSDGQHFKKLLRLLEGDNGWIKLSSRFSKSSTPPWNDTLPLIRTLIAFRPDRMVYGSDYPHPNYPGEMPNEADFLDALLLWTRSEDERERILVHNPATLFGFPLVVPHG